MTRKFLFQSIAVFMSLTVIMSCTKREEASDIAPYSWEVKSIKTPDRDFAESAEESYVLELGTDGSFNLSLDVNNCWGEYAVPSDGQINIEYPGCTKACCDSEFAEELVGLISEVIEFYVVNKILTLQTDEGLTTIKLNRL